MERKGHNSIAQRIKHYRTILGITVDKLAESLNITPGYILDWENGRRTPPAVYIPHLAKKFNVDPAVLYSGEKLPQALKYLQTPGERIRLLRYINGYKQIVLAKILNVTSSAISYWETNKRLPQPDKLYKLAEMFQIPPILIYKGEELNDALRKAASIGERINILRYNAGLTKKVLAKKLNTNPIIITQWEAEEKPRIPTPQSIKKLAQTFEISPSYIYTGKSLQQALLEAKTLGERLRILRYQIGYTSQVVAQEVGVKIYTYSGWENNKHLPPRLKIYRLAKMFNIDWQILLGHTQSTQLNHPRPIQNLKQNASSSYI